MTHARRTGWPRTAVVGGVLWLGAVLSGFAVLVDYETAPGASAAAGTTWPAGAPIARDADLPTLLLFAHPGCPCTRATLRELDRLVAQRHGRMAMHAFFYADPALGADWAHTDLWEHASDIPGVVVHEDPLGEAARLFGAATSGQVLLFATDGQLLFEGGITGSRGHDGDNAGRSALVALLGGETTDRRNTFVFGCPIYSDCARSEP